MRLQGNVQYTMLTYIHVHIQRHIHTHVTYAYLHATSAVVLTLLNMSSSEVRLNALKDRSEVERAAYVASSCSS